MADELRLTQINSQVEVDPPFDDELRLTQINSQVEVYPDFDDELKLTQIMIIVEIVPEGTYQDSPKGSISIIT
ncbi:MAG TPA: hypothetical protein VMZ29_09830 [Candidatus Bathyarchaeia archaeon]|nr:hypothetical protein [Candidatus Bathyarchaeia archaeon]